MSLMDDVLALPWPADAGEVDRLVADGRPRVFLVDEAADPPEINNDLIDWVRLPADRRDIDARMRALARRAAGERHRFALDPFGRLRCGERWVMIHSAIERGLLGTMLGRLGDVVCFDELFEGGWPDGSDSATPNALRVQMTRMNRRIAPLGLAVHGVRAIGYVLDDVRFAPLQPNLD